MKPASTVAEPAKRARILPATEWLGEAHAIMVPVPGAEAAELAAPYFASVEDVWLLTRDWLLLSSSGALLIESLHHTLGANPTKSVYIAALADGEAELALPGLCESLPGPCVLLGGSTSHYHWLLDYMSRLFTIEQFPHARDLPLLVPAAISPVQVESLALLGVAESRLIRLSPDRLYRLGQVWVPSILSDRLQLHPAVFKWLRQRFGAPASVAAPRERLFISRSDALTRRLVNEDEVMAEAARFGFTRIEASRMGFAEQVARFGAAEAVVGVTGSGLANAVFAPANAALVELHNLDRGAHFIELLAAQLGQRYVRLTGQPQLDAARSPHDFDFRFDPLRLRAALQDLGLTERD